MTVYQLSGENRKCCTCILLRIHVGTKLKMVIFQELRMEYIYKSCIFKKTKQTYELGIQSVVTFYKLQWLSFLFGEHYKGLVLVTLVTGQGLLHLWLLLTSECTPSGNWRVVFIWPPSLQLLLLSLSPLFFRGYLLISSKIICFPIVSWTCLNQFMWPTRGSGVDFTAVAIN